MKLKKIVNFVLILVVTFSFAACGNSQNSGREANTEAGSSEVESSEAGSSAAESSEAESSTEESSEVENSDTESSQAQNSEVSKIEQPGSSESEQVTQLPKETPKVYMTSDISPEGLMAVYEALGWSPEGEVAVKLSTGEPPASNYLRPELIKDLVQYVDGTIVECNTAYGGSRGETAMHLQVAKDHGFTDIAEVDIMDADGSISLPVNGGTHLKEDLVGANFVNYDSFLVLSHFKGHQMAGFGGAIKNISIGIASREGKCMIHTAGKSHTSMWGGIQDKFLESMAEAGKAVSDSLGNGKNIVYINVMNRISIDCDCNGKPAEPDIHDIGILSSTDPVALDQACIDLVYAAEGRETLVNRIERMNGLHTLESAENIGLGSRKYELVNLDD
jgi:uncharacterized Fe-S center protein